MGTTDSRIGAESSQRHSIHGLLCLRHPDSRIRATVLVAKKTLNLSSQGTVAIAESSMGDYQGSPSHAIAAHKGSEHIWNRD